MPDRRFLAAILALSALAALPAVGAEKDALAEIQQLADYPGGRDWFDRVNALVNSSEPDDALRVIDTIHRRKLVKAGPALVQALGHYDKRVVAAAAETLDAFAAGFPSPGMVDGMRPLLASSDPKLRDLAMRTAAAARDDEAIAALIDMSDGDGVLNEPARAALKSITGIDCGQRSEKWRTWLEREQKRYDSELPALSRKLEGGDSQGTMDAIGQLQTFVLHRRERADLVAPLATSSDANVAKAARVLLSQTSGMRQPAEKPGEPGSGDAASTTGGASGSASSSETSEDGEQSATAPTAYATSTSAAAKPAPAAETEVSEPPAHNGAITAAVLLTLIAIGGGAAWWVRRLTSGSRMPSVAEVVARAQRDAGIESERNVPVVRPTRPAPVVAGVKPAPPKPAASAKSATSIKGAPKPIADVKIGKRGEKIFKLD